MRAQNTGDAFLRHFAMALAAIIISAPASSAPLVATDGYEAFACETNDTSGDYQYYLLVIDPVRKVAHVAHGPSLDDIDISDKYDAPLTGLTLASAWVQDGFGVYKQIKVVLNAGWVNRKGRSDSVQAEDGYGVTADFLVEGVGRIAQCRGVENTIR